MLPCKGFWQLLLRPDERGPESGPSWLDAVHRRRAGHPPRGGGEGGPAQAQALQAPLLSRPASTSWVSPDSPRRRGGGRETSPLSSTGFILDPPSPSVQGIPSVCESPVYLRAVKLPLCFKEMNRCQRGLIKRTVCKSHRHAFNKEALTGRPHVETASGPFQAGLPPHLALPAIQGGPQRASEGRGGVVVCGVCWKTWEVDWASWGTRLPPDLSVRTGIPSPSSISPPAQSQSCLAAVTDCGPGNLGSCVTWHPSQFPNWGSKTPSPFPLITKSPNSYPYSWAQEARVLGARLCLETLNGGVL